MKRFRNTRYGKYGSDYSCQITHDSFKNAVFYCLPGSQIVSAALAYSADRFGFALSPIEKEMGLLILGSLQSGSP